MYMRLLFHLFVYYGNINMRHKYITVQNRCCWLLVDDHEYITVQKDNVDVIGYWLQIYKTLVAVADADVIGYFLEI